MKKYIFALVLAAVIIPAFASAQTSDVDTSGDASCAIISVNLRYRSTDAATDGAVSVLQDFLSSQGYLNSQPTGFFGSMTRAAVVAFQSANGLSSTPPGFVGAQTRAKIQAIDCNGAASNSAQVSNGNPVVIPSTSQTRAVRTDTNSVSGVPIPDPTRPTPPTQTRPVVPVGPNNATSTVMNKPVPYLPPLGSPVTTICPTGFTCRTNTGVETPPVPTITSLSPTSGVRGSMLTIYGSNFKEITTAVSFKGSGGELQDSSPNSVAQDGRSLKILIPDFAPGVYGISVVNLGNGWRVSNGEHLNFTIEPGIRDEPYMGNTNPGAINATTTPTPYICPQGFTCRGY